MRTCPRHDGEWWLSRSPGGSESVGEGGRIWTRRGIKMGIEMKTKTKRVTLIEHSGVELVGSVDDNNGEGRERERTLSQG